MNDGLFWSAKEVNGVVQFYRSETSTKGAATYLNTPVVFLKIVDNEVVEKTQEEKDAIIAAQIEAQHIAEEQAQNQLLMQQEAKEAYQAAQIASQAAAELIEADRQLRINALRSSYRNCMHNFCELAGIDIVDKIENPSVMIEIINNSEGDIKQQLFMLSMQIKFCLDELRRPSLDGDDAWDRI